MIWGGVSYRCIDGRGLFTTLALAALTYMQVFATRSKRVKSERKILANCTPTSLLSPSGCNDDGNSQDGNSQVTKNRKVSLKFLTISCIMILLSSSYNSIINTKSKNKNCRQHYSSTPKERYIYILIQTLCSFQILEQSIQYENLKFLCIHSFEIGFHCFNQTSSTQYLPMIRYHVKQDAITRNIKMAKWPQKNTGLAQIRPI